MIAVRHAITLASLAFYAAGFLLPIIGDGFHRRKFNGYMVVEVCPHCRWIHGWYGKRLPYWVVIVTTHRFGRVLHGVAYGLAIGHLITCGG